jgi:hypothetical protein
VQFVEVCFARTPGRLAVVQQRLPRHEGHGSWIDAKCLLAERVDVRLDQETALVSKMPYLLVGVTRERTSNGVAERVRNGVRSVTSIDACE